MVPNEELRRARNAEKARVWRRQTRENMTDEERQRYLEQIREKRRLYRKQKWENMTEEQKQEATAKHNEQSRIYNTNRFEGMTEEEKNAEITKIRSHARKRNYKRLYNEAEDPKKMEKYEIRMLENKCIGRTDLVPSHENIYILKEGNYNYCYTPSEMHYFYDTARLIKCDDGTVEPLMRLPYVNRYVSMPEEYFLQNNRKFSFEATDRTVTHQIDKDRSEKETVYRLVNR